MAIALPVRERKKLEDDAVELEENLARIWNKKLGKPPDYPHFEIAPGNYVPALQALRGRPDTKELLLEAVARAVKLRKAKK